MTTDEMLMRRCFSLAQKGRGNVSPNPLVGAVIVKNGEIIGEGYHKRYGAAHAEIVAIQNALKNVTSLSGAILYVNLEPCFHYGNTAPCVDTILRHKFKRVVISTKDPNPLVSGKSIHKLRQQGIECELNVLKNEGKDLNEKFFSFITTHIPFVSLKVAQTKDGFIAKNDGSSRWITNILSRRYVHHLRGEYDAVLVGANTVIVDNPLLTVRSSKGRNPIRIVLDGKLRSPVNSKIFNGDSATIVYTSDIMSQGKKKKIQSLDNLGIAVVQLPSKNGRIKIKSILKDLGKHKISSLLVEGGQQVYQSFLYERCVQKIYQFTSPKEFHSGISAFGDISMDLRSTLRQRRYFATDELKELYVHS
jgi:diaminohydroxyphosphoribosylaminopyrimidine deaminase/5-amino-6-(5-phosphoribosylamino)uracil reductase